MRIGLARLKPSTDEWVDAAFVVATTGLSLIGFRRSFGGWDFLTAGLLGCVVAMLVAEEVDAETGEMLGNFPQAFSHVGLVMAAIALSRRRHNGTPPLHW